MGEQGIAFLEKETNAMRIDSYNCRDLPNLLTNDDIDPDDNFYNGHNVDIL